MLKRISITNYLLIDALALDLGKGLTIITGETGSGKSILVGALSLAMGERAESGALRDPEKRCVIELEVDVTGLDLSAWFEVEGITYEPVAILRRQLEPGGRSRAFVNDTPVRLEQLRELGGRLIHVHSQHHTLLLNDAAFQLGMVDHFADQQPLVSRYHAAYQDWNAVRRELIALREEEFRLRGELDLVQFQLNELEAAALRPHEEARIEQELSRADHAEELIAALRTAAGGIDEERGASQVLSDLHRTLAKVAGHDPVVAQLVERLESVRIELKDIGEECGVVADGISLDPQETERLRERSDLLLRLQQKHRVTTNEELIALQHGLRQRMEHMDLAGDRMAALEQREKHLGRDVRELADVISGARMQVLRPLAEKVEGLLTELGMPDAAFHFEHLVLGNPGPQGIDSVRMLFTANKDRKPAALDKVASGGELSRVMLALIDLSADTKDLPTVLFDEIDTGVSGEVADRVGTLMARMGKERQVLAITHLPQIASKAQDHLLVTKSSTSTASHTRISALTMEERVEAIAHMLSGRKLTKAAVENARVLLKGR